MAMIPSSEVTRRQPVNRSVTAGTSAARTSIEVMAHLLGGKITAPRPRFSRSMASDRLLPRTRRVVWDVLSRPAVSRTVTTVARPFGRRLPPWLTVRIPVVREFEIGIPGTVHSFRVETDNRDISVSVFWRGLQAWEPTLGRVLLELGRRSATFFDVGPNVGLASLLVAASSAPTRVHAFEPVPQIFERLRRNVE